MAESLSRKMNKSSINRYISKQNRKSSNTEPDRKVKYSTTLSVEEEHVVTWARFQEIFLTKYFPRNVKDDMVEEFLKLEQGEDETVKDYEARFARLSRFATHVIDTEKRRSTRFKNRLRNLDKAQRVEKDVEAGCKYYKEQRQKRGREEDSSRGNDVVQPKSKNNNLATKEPFKNTQEPVEACKTCGKNHRVSKSSINRYISKQNRKSSNTEPDRKESGDAVSSRTMLLAFFLGQFLDRVKDFGYSGQNLQDFP
ncbi:hypothetical protein RJ640_008419 [Escallonia rubra]|uniref:Retrotransposon gag domain-containing protein n=1 Tax=Escallonia rubra TaxID=112253 RepID=A0AA88RVJ2_9ASTE|nr:hypothetical protein RJ640_008419 [Escallonia rubra]